MPDHRVLDEYAMHRATNAFDADDDDDMPPLVDAPPFSMQAPGGGHRQMLYNPNPNADDHDHDQEPEDDDMPPLVDRPDAPAFMPFPSFHDSMDDDADDNDIDNDLPPLVDSPFPPLFGDDHRFGGAKAHTTTGGGGMQYTFTANVTPMAFGGTMNMDDNESVYGNGALMLSHSSPNPPSPPPESPPYTSSPTPSPVFPSSCPPNMNFGPLARRRNSSSNSNNVNAALPMSTSTPASSGMTYNFSFSSSPDNMSSLVPFESSRLGTDTTSGALTLPPPFSTAPAPTNASNTTTSSSHSKKRPPSYIPRPPNAFILFRASFVRAQRIPGRVEGNHSTLSKIAGMYWKGMRKEEREVWERKAEAAQEEHRRKYPDWRFRMAGRGGGGGGSAGGGLGKVKDGTGGGGMGTGEETIIHSGSGGSSSIDASPAPAPTTTTTTARKRRNSAREQSEDEQRTRQRRCEKIVDLLGEGKTGAALAEAVEEFDRSQAGMKKEDMSGGASGEEKGKGTAIVKTGKGKGKGKAVETKEKGKGKEKVERPKVQIQTQIQTQTQVPVQSQVQSQGQIRKTSNGRKRAGTMSTNMAAPTITSIVPMTATTATKFKEMSKANSNPNPNPTVKRERERSISANEAVASKSMKMSEATNTPLVTSNASNTSNSFDTSTSFVVRTNTSANTPSTNPSNARPSPHLPPPPTPVPPSPSPPSDTRFSIPLTAIARRSSTAPRSSSAPAAPGRIPGVGYSTLSLEMEMGPIKSPFSAFLGGAGEVGETVGGAKRSGARMIEGASGVSGKGEREEAKAAEAAESVEKRTNDGKIAVGAFAGDEGKQRVNNTTSMSNFSAYVHPSTPLGFSYSESNAFPTLTSAYTRNPGAIEPVTAQTMQHGQNNADLSASTVNVSSYSTLRGWAGANAASDSTPERMRANAAGDGFALQARNNLQARINGMGYNIGMQTFPSAAYTAVNVSAPFRSQYHNDFSGGASSAIPMSSLVPMPLAAGAQSISAALHNQDQDHYFASTPQPQYSFTSQAQVLPPPSHHHHQSGVSYSPSPHPNEQPYMQHYPRGRQATNMFEFPSTAGGNSSVQMNGLPAAAEGEFSYLYGR